MVRLEAIQVRWKFHSSLMARDVAWLVDTVDKLRDVLIASKIPHRIVDGDCWFSCPKSGESCRDDQVKTECDCGADAHNARISDAIILLEELDA